MQITNGSVSRTYKPADYEGRTVSLSFTIDDGEDAGMVTAKVALLAEIHARTMPKLAEAPKTQQRATRPPRVEPPSPTAHMADIVIDDPTPAAEPEGMTGDAPILEPEADAAMIVEPERVEPATVEEKPVTDKDLHAGVHLALERKVSNKAIKDLIAEYTGEAGKSMVTMAAEKRPAFLAALKAL